MIISKHIVGEEKEYADTISNHRVKRLISVLYQIVLDENQIHIWNRLILKTNYLSFTFGKFSPTPHLEFVWMN